MNCDGQITDLPERLSLFKHLNHENAKKSRKFMRKSLTLLKLSQTTKNVDTQNDKTLNSN